MKILITGASGLLGDSLMELLSKTEETIGTYFKNQAGNNLHFLDITSKEEVDSFFERTLPELVIHTASIVDVDFCEENKEAARLTNIEGTRNIINACKKYSSKLIYISSDYIFDGQENNYSEESPPNPLNYYGFTKLESEKIIKESLKDYIIIRPGILYGNDENSKPSFISQVLKKLKNNEKVFVDDKIIKYPTLTSDVSEAIKKLISLNASGVYNVSGEEPITRYQWALKIAKFYKFPLENIIKQDAQTKAKKPLNVKLDISKIKNLGVAFSDVETGLKTVHNQKGCMWNLIYSARPDMLINGQSASMFRIEVGKRLAKEYPVDADIVIPIPESGIYGATGYSAQSKIPFYFGLIRDYYTKKTIYEPTLEMRNKALNQKIIIVSEVVKDKRIVVVDEAIIAGTTLLVTVDKLKKAGAKEIHVRIPSPPMNRNCISKKLNQDAKLIAKEFGDNKEEIEEGLRKYFNVDSLRFLSVNGFLESFSSINPHLNRPCIDCFIEDKNQNIITKPTQDKEPKIIRIDEIPDEQREGGNYSIKRMFTEKLRKNPDNIGFYQTTILPRNKVKHHSHQQLDEVLYFLTPGKVRIKSKIYEFNPGDVMILPPDTPHEIFAEDKKVVLIAVKLPNIPDDKVIVD